MRSIYARRRAKAIVNRAGGAGGRDKAAYLARWKSALRLLSERWESTTLFSPPEREGGIINTAQSGAANRVRSVSSNSGLLVRFGRSDERFARVESKSSRQSESRCGKPLDFKALGASVIKVGRS